MRRRSSSIIHVIGAKPNYMKMAIVLGTRPEIIKMAPVIRACDDEKIDYQIIHTGQHYSYELDGVFFEALNLPEPNHNIKIGSGTHAEETAKCLIGIEQILIQEKPDVILVEGDTNTVLAGALTASKLHIKVGHVEAGLRSGDRGMPEEINRILTDHLSDSLFAPTQKAKKNLLREGISGKNIFVTGNTIVDAVYQNLDIARGKANILDKLKLSRKNYFLLTIHRQENTDSLNRFRGILEGLELVFRKIHLPIIYPIHPRAQKWIKEYHLKMPKGTQLIKPVGYLEFLQLEENARLILTDSGGIQEEACILHIPCVTLRENTERPETVELGANMLASCEPSNILKSAQLMMHNISHWANPFGDGTAGKKIISILTQRGVKEAEQ